MTSAETEANRPDQRPSRLERPATDRWVAGVARGLAGQWGAPAWLIRLAFIILTAAGGLGIVLYGLGWLLIPREGCPAPIISDWIVKLRDRQAWLGAALVAAAAIIVISSLDLIAPSLIWAGALLVLGALLYRGDLGNLHSERPPAPPRLDEWEADQASLLPEFDRAALGDDERQVNAQSLTAPPRRERLRREPSFLGRLTLGAMLVTIGIMAAVDISDLTHPTTRHYLAAAILVVGIGLLVGGFLGRSRGLIVFGLLLTPLVLVASLADFRFGGEFGDIDVFATTPAELQARYLLAGGEIFLDLSRLELEGETVTIGAEVGAGRIGILLPPDYQVEIDGGVRLGELELLGRTRGGLDLGWVATRPGTGGTINLLLDAGVGNVAVRDPSHFADFEFPSIVSSVHPRSIDELQPSYSLGAGTLQLDLRDLPPNASWEDRVVSVEVIVGRGEILILIPPWLSASVFAQSSNGVVDLFGSQIHGVNVSDEVNVEGSGGGFLDLSLFVEQGTITVVRP